MAVFVKPFDRLLNAISHELGEQNLKSLIHICNYYVSAREREKITDGHDLFRVLRQRGVLSEDRDKIGNLLEIIKEMRPKRQDLVDKVTNFIRTTVEAPDTILVLGSESLEASGSDCLRLVRESRCDTPLLVPSDWRFCSMNCCCWSCNCYSRRCPPYVCGILAGIFVLLAVMAAIAWYGDVPRISRYLTDDEEIRKSGKYAVGLLGFVGLLFVFVALVKYRLDRSNNYVELNAPSVADSSVQRHYSSQNSTDTGSYRSLPRDTARKAPRTGSKASSYASNSTTSINGHLSRVNSMLPRDVIADGARCDRLGGSADSSDFEVEGFMFPQDPESVQDGNAEHSSLSTNDKIDV